LWYRVAFLTLIFGVRAALRTPSDVFPNIGIPVVALEIRMKTKDATPFESGTSLRGKVAVVTGAARGIGRATALAFAREGADVVGFDISAPVDVRSGVQPANSDELKETGLLVEATGRRWMGAVLDQRDLSALRASAAQAESVFGGIDILFANAGIQSFHPLLDMEDPDWHITIDVNLTGTANALRAFAPYIVKRGGGRIIVTSSTQGRHGMKFGAAYSASKWGIIGLMKSAALELGSYNITVNAVIPGLIDTPLTRHEERYAQVLQDGGRSPTGSDEAEVRKILAARTPLGVPWIEPEDVAPVVLFLASDAARMVSGATYDVTAGDSARNTA
jgi:NAD(P)-dependent dehydrogenase (short-subunit alcohol dehydrogenase family)